MTLAEAAELRRRMAVWEREFSAVRDASPDRGDNWSEFVLLNAEADRRFPGWRDAPDPEREAGIEQVRANWTKIRAHFGVLPVSPTLPQTPPPAPPAPG